MSKRVPAEVLNGMLAKAKGKLVAARRELKAGFPDEAVSRAYYAAYHAISAVLASQGCSFSSHAQTIGGFNARFVKAGLFPKDTTQKLHRLFESRQAADYDWTAVVDRDSARCNVKDAADLVAACREYVKRNFLGSKNAIRQGLPPVGPSSGSAK